MKKYTKHEKKTLYTASLLGLLGTFPLLALSVALLFFVAKYRRDLPDWVFDAYYCFFVTFVPGLAGGVSINSWLVYRRAPHLFLKGPAAFVMMCMATVLMAVLLVGFIKFDGHHPSVTDYALWTAGYLAGAAMSYIIARLIVKRILDQPEEKNEEE